MMPGTPARSGGVVLAGSGVFAIIVAGAGLAPLMGVATPAQAKTVPVTVTPAIAMPGLPVTFTINHATVTSRNSSADRMS